MSRNPYVSKPFAEYPFAEGDKARYTALFLRSTGQILDSDGTHGWAEVVKVSKFGERATVTLRWPGGLECKVLDTNLQRQGAPLRLRDVTA